MGMMLHRHWSGEKPAPETVTKLEDVAPNGEGEQVTVQEAHTKRGRAKKTTE
jgi:Na+-transporting methylmalonyl-CoA/oxaloacetate decarboxylase gamma subunit